MAQIFVGRIDDRIRCLRGDVALHDLDGLACGKNAFGKNVVHKVILPVKAYRDDRPVVPVCFKIIYFAWDTIAAKALGSRTAISASILRLRPMFAFFNAAMSRL